MKKEHAFLGILYVAIIASLVIILGIILPSGNKVDASDGCKSSFAQPISVENGCGMLVKEGAGQVDFTYSTDLKQGSIEWTLKDPSGQIVWQSDAEGTIQGKHTLTDPRPGQYDLRISTNQAQGSYEFAMK